MRGGRGGRSAAILIDRATIIRPIVGSVTTTMPPAATTAATTTRLIATIDRVAGLGDMIGAIAVDLVLFGHLDILRRFGCRHRRSLIGNPRRISLRPGVSTTPASAAPATATTPPRSIALFAPTTLIHVCPRRSGGGGMSLGLIRHFA